MSNSIVIVAAKRTAVGNFNGSLSTLPASKLGEIVIKDLLDGINIKSEEISEVILGQVLTGGTGQNPARQAAINAGIPKEVPAWLVNSICGSGLKSVMLGCQSIMSGSSEIVIAGGQESMSQSGHFINLRNPTKMGDAKLVDSMILDGLMDYFNNYHMGITAENIAEKYSITKDEQDEFSVNSQNKAENARNSGKFKDEIVPVTIKTRKEESFFDKDEFIRDGATFENIAKLKPAFKKENGTVTAGNASGINDGAAAVILMTEKMAKSKNLEILAKVESFAHAGVAPEIMGTGPIPASKKALKLAGWDVKELDIIEANEAFAAQAISVNKEMGWDTNKVNVNGGAIAIGHPIGASGTRILTTLLHEMKRSNYKKGLATLCIGGGMGVAMCLSR